MTTDENATLDDLPTPEYNRTLHPEELETDGDNPNEMTDEQFGLLCERMQSNGWLGGPIITNLEGVIADGEHRWRAAQEIGLQEVPVKQYEITEATRRLWRQELNKIHGEHDTKRDALEYDYLLNAGKSDEVTALTDAADEDLDELLAQLRMESEASPRYEYDPDHSVYFEDATRGIPDRLEDADEDHLEHLHESLDGDDSSSSTDTPTTPDRGGDNGGADTVADMTPGELADSLKEQGFVTQDDAPDIVEEAQAEASKAEKVDEIIAGSSDYGEEDREDLLASAGKIVDREHQRVRAQGAASLPGTAGSLTAAAPSTDSESDDDIDAYGTGVQED